MSRKWSKCRWEPTTSSTSSRVTCCWRFTSVPLPRSTHRLKPSAASRYPQPAPPGPAHPPPDPNTTRSISAPPRRRGTRRERPSAPLEWSEVLAGGREQLGAGRVTALDELHEDRTGLGEQLDLFTRPGHRPVVSSALHRGFGADHPDPAIVGRPHRGANAGIDDPDDRDARRDPDLFDGGNLD